MDARVTEVEDKTRQLDQDLIRYETEIQTAKLQLQSIILDLEAFEADLLQAAADGKQALEIHHNAILSERERIRQRLHELDALILSWGRQPTTEPQGTLTPVPGGLIIPEQQSDSPDAASANTATEETTVWKNRQSGSSSR
jgi:hypothetical protein